MMFILGCSFNLSFICMDIDVCPDNIYTSFFFFLFFVEEQTEIRGGWEYSRLDWAIETMLHGRLASF